MGSSTCKGAVGSWKKEEESIEGTVVWEGSKKIAMKKNEPAHYHQRHNTINGHGNIKEEPDRVLRLQVEKARNVT